MRLAFEVDDDHVVLRHQHLAEVKVAMDAGLESGRREIAQRPDAIFDRRPRRAQRSGVRAGLALQRL